MARLSYQKSELRKWVSATYTSHRPLFFLLWFLAFLSLIVWQRNIIPAISWPPQHHYTHTPSPLLRPHSFNLTDFGAVGDGKTLNTQAFQKAVAAIASVAGDGGGQLNVAAGQWLTAPFNLTSHMTLFLATDAVILAAQDESLWPVMPALPSYGRGRERSGPRYGSLIHGQHLEDVVITGHNGTIDGQGQSWWKKQRAKKLHYTRGPLIQFMWCTNIVISDVTLQNSPFWTLHPYDSTNITIRGLTIVNPVNSPNTDGIDPDSCQNVIVENSYISVGDDCIAIKSGWDQYGIAYGRPSTNILIHNITAHSPVSAGVSIGSEMSGGITNITIDGLTVWESRRGVRIKTSPGRGGYVTNVSYKNLMFDTVRVGIVIKTDYGDHPDDKYDPMALPILENITFRGIRGRNVRIPVRIYGSPEVPVRKVEFQDMDVGTTNKKKHIFQCSFVEGKVVGRIYPRPCESLDVFNENGIRIHAANSSLFMV